MSLEKKLKAEYDRGYQEALKKAKNGDRFAKYKDCEQCNHVHHDELTIYIALRSFIKSKIQKSFHKKSGGQYIGICPFHKENTPSCVYTVMEDNFYCFSCGSEGEGILLALALNHEDGHSIKMERVSEEEFVKLAEKTGKEINDSIN